MLRKAFPFFVVLLLLGLYLHTAPPEVVPGDSGELATVAWNLDIAHPPGYPLWVLLAHPFTRLPIGNLAWRLEIFQCFLAGTTALLAGIIALSLGVPGTLSWGLALLVGLLPPVWSQTQTNEVYLLTGAGFLAAAAVLTLGQRGRNGRRRALILAFLLGLGAGHHGTTFLLAPILVLASPLTARKLWGRRPWEVLCGLILAAVLGASVTGCLPLRSSTAPPLNWGQPFTAGALWSHVSRGQYGSLAPLPFSWGRLWQEAVTLGETVKGWWTPAGSTLLFAGFLWGLLRELRLTLAVTGCFLAGTIGFMLLLRYPVTERGLYEAEQFFLPAAMASVGIMGLMAKAVAKRSRWWHIALATFFGCLAALQGYQGITTLDRRDSWAGMDYGTSLLGFLPRGSTLIVEGDNAAFLTAYRHIAQGYRPDIEVLDVNGFIFQGSYGFAQLPPASRSAIVARLLAQGKPPVFFSHPPPLPPGSPLTSHIHGLTTWLGLPEHQPTVKEAGFMPRFSGRSEDYLERLFRNEIEFQWGMHLVSQWLADDPRRELKAGDSTLDLASSLLAESEAQAQDVQLAVFPREAPWVGRGIAALNLGRPEEAVYWFRQVPDEPACSGLAPYYLGNLALRKEDKAAALNHFLAALRRSPGLLPAQINLANLFYEGGRIPEAVAAYRKVVDLDDRQEEARYNLATGLALLGRTEEAIIEYRTLLAYNFAHPRAHVNLGALYLTQGQAAEAAGEWNLALSIDPAIPGLREKLEGLGR